MKRVDMTKKSAVALFALIVVLSAMLFPLSSQAVADSPKSWTPMHSGTTNDLHGIWGSSGNDVFAVAFGGIILHYDGSAWSPMTSGTTHILISVWGTSSSDVFAVGECGILHYDGSSWSSMSSGTGNRLRGVWGSSASDVFAVGYKGIILHYDGASWSPMSSGSTATLKAVWGSSGNDVFAVAMGGTILHYDGIGWDSMTSGTTHNLLSVWGRASSDVFAVGDGGTILHYDGTAWSPMASGSTSHLRSVWGNSHGDVFVVGHDGTILYYDGTVWHPMASGTTSDLISVWGSSNGDVFAVGLDGTIPHYAESDSELATRIAFNSNRVVNMEVYVMNADGSNQTNLTHNSADDWHPVWSPDGGRIAFSTHRDGNHEIYVMNADGSDQTRLTDNPADDHYPAWSPDGARLVFYSFRDGNREIYVMNADGSNETRLTNNPGQDLRPVWSPDGTRIAFDSDRDGNQDVYVMNADGSNQTQITSNPADDQRPAWAPFTRIAFESNRDGNWEIYVMNADGGNQTRLTNNSSGDSCAAWSPDGTKIAFARDRPSRQIYVMNADGRNQIRLTSTGGNTLPSWSPDGTGALLPPSAPSSLSCSSVLPTKAALTWQDNSDNEDGFKIERRLGTTGNWVQIAAVGANVVTYNDAGLSPGTTYQYRIRAHNEAGTSSYSNATSVKAPPPPDITPTVISDVSVKPVAETSASITWATDEPATGQVEYGKTAQYGLASILEQTPATTHLVTLTHLEPGTTYHYRVTSRDEAGNEAASEDEIFVIPHPDAYAPQLLLPDNRCTDWPVTPVLFDWSPFKESTNYRFVLATDAAFTDIVAEAQVATTAFEYNGTLDYNTDYFWRVIAIEPAPSDWSASFSFQTKAAPEAPPAAPKAPSSSDALQPAIWTIIGVSTVVLVIYLPLNSRRKRLAREAKVVKEYEDKLRQWERESYNVSHLRQKWFPSKSSLPIAKNWFERHLNWTFVLAWVASHIMICTLWIGFSGIYAYSGSETIAVGILALSPCIILLAAPVWLIRHKGRSLWHLSWVFLGVGPIVWLCLKNERQKG